MGPRVGFIALLLATMAAPSGAVPLEIYGRLPTVDDIDISTDGNTLGIVTTGVDGNQLQVRGTDLGLKAVIRLGMQKVIGLQWVDSDHIMVITESATKVSDLEMARRSRWWVPNLVDVKASKVINLLDDVESGNRYEGKEFLNVIAGWPQPRTIDGHTQIFLPGIAFTNLHGMLTMFKQGFGAGGAKIVESGGVDTRAILVDLQGRPVAREDYDDESGAWSLSVKTSGWQKVQSVTAKLDRPSLEGFGRTDRTVIISQLEDNGERYREVAIDGGTLSAPIAALDDMSLIKDPVKRTVLGGVDTAHMKVRYAFLDPADQQIWSRVERAFPGEFVRLVSWSDDRTKLVLHVEGQKSGNAFYLLDLAARSASPIADEYAGLEAKDLNEVRTISYSAQDGLTIPAFLTLPQGVPAKNLPLVVLVHGGPAAHDRPGFDWWSQGIASLGYAVLQPQYRGSTSSDRGFMEAGYGQWGRKMQTDVSDGVKSLAAQGIIDPGRVCIVGGSYGGYAAMAGVTLQSGIYRCAIAVAGVADLPQMLARVRSDHSSHSESMRYWERFMGAKGAGDNSLDALSPAKHADKLSAPLLLIHGEIDTVVDPAQSQMMQSAAQRAGKQVQLIMLKGEDHNLARGATRLQMLQATADFLRANLPVTPANQTAAR